jgi:hypothetical protein
MMTGSDARPTKVVQGIVHSIVAWASVPGKLCFRVSDLGTGEEYVIELTLRSTKQMVSVRSTSHD